MRSSAASSDRPEPEAAGTPVAGASAAVHHGELMSANESTASSTAPSSTASSLAGRPRLLLADPQALVIEALRRVLCPEFEVLDAVADGEALLAAACDLRPDLILLELSLPQVDGLDAVRVLRTRAPELRCLFVTQHAALHHVRAAFAAGASGYVLKESTPAELREAVWRISRGDVYVSPKLRVDEACPGSVTRQGSGALTMRQREVLRRVAEGRTGKQIASELGISLKTVESHKACISRQLGLRSTAALTRHAIELGLVRAADGVRIASESEHQGLQVAD
jgi:DNA-binding NarL/FixJ family response regulator